jgi:hypothetical protein
MSVTDWEAHSVRRSSGRIFTNLGNNVMMGGSIVAGCGGTGKVNGAPAPACNGTTFLPARFRSSGG